MALGQGSPQVTAWREPQAALQEEASGLSSEGRGLWGHPAPDPGCRLLSARPRAPGVGLGGPPCTR